MFQSVSHTFLIVLIMVRFAFHLRTIDQPEELHSYQDKVATQQLKLTKLAKTKDKQVVFTSHRPFPLDRVEKD